MNGTFLLSGGNPAVCGPTVLNANGGGTVTHLGKSTFSEQWCWTGELDNLGTRTSVITAANGDELHCTILTIDWPAPNVYFIETVKIEGGTGRFANASGSFTQTVEIEFDGPASGTFVMTAEGTINY